LSRVGRRIELCSGSRRGLSGLLFEADDTLIQPDQLYKKGIGLSNVLLILLGIKSGVEYALWDSSPIQDQTPQEIAANAEAVIGEIVARLT
jgi:hypothetical protein